MTRTKGPFGIDPLAFTFTLFGLYYYSYFIYYYHELFENSILVLTPDATHGRLDQE